MAITVVKNTSNNSTITINDGSTINDVFISKISVFSNTEAQTVTIQWDETHYITALYTDYATPSGGSAAAVEAAIAALLVLPPSIHLLAAYTSAKGNAVNLNTTVDQSIDLSGGTTFVITDIILTNVSIALNNAKDGEWWQSTSRSGNQIAIEGGLPVTLQTSSNYESITSVLIATALGNQFEYRIILLGKAVSVGTLTYYIQNTCTSPIYFSLGTPEGVAAHCDMYIYGYILS